MDPIEGEKSASLPGKIRILIADGDETYAEITRRILAHDAEVEVIGITTDGESTVAMAHDLRPQVVVMDTHLPGLDCVAATEAIKKANPAIQVVMITLPTDMPIMRRAHQVGAIDFLGKPPTGDDLIQAIRRAAEEYWRCCQ
jgi:DNA-binding NarL/FixJ family response regulator